MRAWRRPILAGAAAAAGISVAVTLVGLPVRVVARERAKDVGLVTQDWVGFAGDVAKSIGIEIVLTGAGGALLVFGMRRFGRRWWAPGAALIAAFGVILTYASPILLEPLFNRFKPLPAGPTRTAVLDYAREAGVEGRRGLRDGRLAPDDRRQRVRRRARARPSASCSTTRCCGTSSRTRSASSWRTSWATCTTATCPAACSSWRSWRRSGCSWSPAWASASRRAGASGRPPRCPASCWRSRSPPPPSRSSPTSSRARSRCARTASRSS